MERLDKTSHRSAFEKNKKRIYEMAKRNSELRVCAICGTPLDLTLKYPNPLAPTIDHIVPVSKGGHPSAIENLQLAHFTCNRQKSDKMPINKPLPIVTNKSATNKGRGEVVINEVGNDELPLYCDWSKY